MSDINMNSVRHVQHKHMKNLPQPEKKRQYHSSSQRQLHFHNRRQFENVGISLSYEIIFSFFLLVLLFVFGFVLGYNFSGTQSALFYDKSESPGYSNSALSNTDTKTITTYSNSSVTNTNNDKDTITNTVSG